jgi:hypothetical protein
MPPEHPAPMRVSALLRTRVHDAAGRPVGRVADLETRRDEQGREIVVAALVTAGRWGRLLGYERGGKTGPWLLEKLARHVLRRRTVREPWDRLDSRRAPDRGAGDDRGG